MLQLRGQYWTCLSKHRKRSFIRLHKLPDFAIMSGHPGLRTPQAKFSLLKKLHHLDDIKGKYPVKVISVAER